MPTQKPDVQLSATLLFCGLFLGTCSQCCVSGISELVVLAWDEYNKPLQSLLPLVRMGRVGTGSLSTMSASKGQTFLPLTAL